jgi:histone H3/H4
MKGMIAMEENQNYWRKCGTCKKEIGFNTIYQMCNVSTCKKLVFCSVDCWNLHNPVMNHKSSWAEENRSPRREDFQKEELASTAPRRIIVQSKNTNEQTTVNEVSEKEILIVASKLKAYIKDKYDMNTSANVMDILSGQVRRLTDKAVAKARSEGRKTVMDRDYE